MLVEIGPDGVVIDAAVAISSGSDALDDAAVTWVKANWRWEPVTRDCRPAKVKTGVNIVWRLSSR